MSWKNYWFAIGVVGNVTKYIRCLAVYLLQHKVTQMLQNVSSEQRWEQTKYTGEWFQEIVCKTNIKSTTSSAKIAKRAKTWKLVHNVKSVTSSTFECKFVLRIGFIVKAFCSMSRVSLMHIINMTRCFGTKNNRNHLVGLPASSATMGVGRIFSGGGALGKFS